jgi:acyl-coenzyme A thioesterase PaaI-like protein
VVTRGRQIISAEGRVLDSEGRVLAHGTSTLMVFGNGKNGGERPVST